MSRNTRLPRILSFTLATALATAALVGVTVAPASAHTPAATATCSKLSVSLKSYESNDRNKKPNSIVVSIAGAEVANESFGATYARDFTFADSTKAYKWKVVIDAVGRDYDRTFENTTTPCPAPLPKDATATLHTTPPSCTAPGKLVLDGVVNATWSKPTATVGPSNYSVTATATKGHLFDDGKPTRVLTGTLPGQLDAASAACKPTPTPTPTPPTKPTTPTTPTKPTTPTTPTTPQLPAKPAPLQLSAQTVSTDCSVNTVTTVTTTTTTDWVANTGRTGWVRGTPVETVTTDRQPAPATVCPVAVVPAGEVSAAIGGGGAGLGTESLAHSGTDSMPGVAAAIALLLGGVVLALVRRRSAVSDS